MTHTLHVSEPASLSDNATVGGLVAAAPGRSRVFEQLGIDYCCGGKLSLAEACRKRGLDPAAVVQKLAEFDAAWTAPVDTLDPASMSLAGLADHIVATHHAYLKSELPRLETICEKVARVHGSRDPRLAKLRRAFTLFSEEMHNHMAKEEHILFPMIRALEASRDLALLHCGSLGYPIRQMEAEHDSAGGGVSLLRELTDGFTPPDWACNTYRAMLDALAQVERDLHLHVHKENNILFPRALELEASLRSLRA